MPDLWVAVSGYSPRLGSTFLTGTFKECETIGVLNRVREKTDQILVVSSAGKARRAFLERGVHCDEPAIIVLPERAMPRIAPSELRERAPLLVLITGCGKWHWRYRRVGSGQATASLWARARALDEYAACPKLAVYPDGRRLMHWRA